MSGTITKEGRRFTVQFERSLAHAPEKVWRVITDKKLLNQWFPAHVVGDWTVGAKLEFIFQHGEGEGLPEEELRGEVLAVEPLRLLEFRWGTSRLRCELVEEGDGCKLIFSDSFEDGSIAARNAAGWEWCLENLSAVLDGVTVASFDLEQWRGPFQRYVEKFQPLAGPQQGPPEDHPAVAEEQAKLGKKKGG